MSEIKWGELNHEVPQSLDKYVVMLASACSADNQLKLLTRFQKVVRLIKDEQIDQLQSENKALRCALEKYKGVKMLIEVESGFPEIKATTFVDIATETLKQLTQTGGKGAN